MVGNKNPQGRSRRKGIELKVQRFSRFKRAYRELFDSTSDSGADTRVTLDQYFGSVMFAVKEAVPRLPLKEVEGYLCSVAVHLSRFIGDADYFMSPEETGDAVYLARCTKFASQMRYLMHVKDAAYNGEGTNVSLVVHNDNVSAYSRRLAHEMGIPPEATEEQAIAGSIHDLGKLGIADAIIIKKGPLTPEEREKVESHSEYGASIIRRTGFEKVSSLVLCHHRRYDGGGYPSTENTRTLTHDPAFSILAVADVFDVVSRGRPYRTALGPHGAVKELAENAGTQFHPEVVEAAVKTGCLADEFKRRKVA